MSDDTRRAFIRKGGLISFGKVLKEWQVEMVVQILKMAKGINECYKSHFLVVHPTGQGKSLVRDLVCRILRCVSLTVCPLLSLVADQVESINQYSANLHTRPGDLADKYYKAINLDAIVHDQSNVLIVGLKCILNGNIVTIIF